MTMTLKESSNSNLTCIGVTRCHALLKYAFIYSPNDPGGRYYDRGCLDEKPNSE